MIFHDGQTGQIILPVLRLGNSHSNKWYVAILKRVIQKIRTNCPMIKIIIRGDSKFSCATFYELAEQYDLYYPIGLAFNEILKRRVRRVQKAVSLLCAENKEKHQHFFSFKYGAKSWHKEQACHAKVESTGIGLNTRFIISNLTPENACEGHYTSISTSNVQRGVKIELKK